MSRQGSNENIQIVSTRNMADLFGISERRVQQLTNEGAFVRVARGEYDLRQSIHAWTDYMVRDAIGDAASHQIGEEELLDPALENALWTKRRRQKTETELAIIRGELHRSEDVKTIVGDMLASFRARLMSMPSKIAPLVIGREDISEVEKFVKDAVYEALHELKDYDPKEYYALSKDVMLLTEEEAGDV